MTADDAMSEDSRRSGEDSRRYPVSWVVLFILLMALLHVRAFYQIHDEGDEKVYLAVAESMGWDFSNYSARDDPEVRRYPYSIYRQSLFHQPPLFPLVLKIGASFGQAIYAGLVFQMLAMVLLLIVARRAAMLFGLSGGLQVALYAGLTFCPLLLFSTTRLHHDGLLAIFAFCAFTMFIEALDARSTGKAVVAGLFFVLALNVRYNAIVLLPLIFLFQLFHLYRVSSDPAVDVGTVVRERREWKVFAIVVAMVLALGLPHYYRVLATYGSLLPSTFIIPDVDVEAMRKFTRRISERSRMRVSIYLVLIFPLLLTWLSRSHVRLVAARLRERSWGVMYLALVLSLYLVYIAILPGQERYFAVLTPFMFVWFVLQIQGADAPTRRFLWQVGAFTLFLMFVGGISSAIFRPVVAQAVPALINLLPFLNPYYL